MIYINNTTDQQELLLPKSESVTMVKGGRVTSVNGYTGDVNIKSINGYSLMGKGDLPIDAIRGPQGPQGEIGPIGPRGLQGPKGDKGDKGDRGAQGAQGPQGERGTKGSQGERGPQGPQGIKGERGPQGVQGPQGEAGNSLVPRTKHVAYDVFLIEYDSIDYDYAYNHYPEPVMGGCSAFYKDGKVMRNFDWKYDNTASFIIKTESYAAQGMNTTVGFCGGIPELTGELVRSGKYSDKYKILPFMLQDGVNNRGLFCSMHLVPLKHNTATGGEGICNTMLVRYILDTYRRLNDLKSDKNIKVFNHPDLAAAGYELQFFICDTSKSYSIEIQADGSLLFTETDALTNFHVSGVNFNSDGTVNTPWTNLMDNKAPSENNITGYESGLERWNVIMANKDSDMEDLAKKLWYTNTYKIESDDQKWFSEYVGNGLDINSSDWDSFVERFNEGVEEYSHRQKDGKTWHTVHTIISDLNIRDTQFFIYEFYYKYDMNLQVSDFEYITKRQSQQDKEDIRTDVLNTVHYNYIANTYISAIWKGTEEEYNALSIKDPNTFYIITE